MARFRHRVLDSAFIICALVIALAIAAGGIGVLVGIASRFAILVIEK